MILYYLHDMQQRLLEPLRVAAETTQKFLPCNPFMPQSLERIALAGAEMAERTTRNFAKPSFRLPKVRSRGEEVTVEEEIVLSLPFCRLIHFKRSTPDPQIAACLADDPPVLIAAPISGHFATLLRGTVEAMLPEHDVYITDWIDAKVVPLSQGKFDLEDNITYIMQFLRFLGPGAHVMAVCQPTVPVLCAVALLADMQDPAQPRSMVLMGGPVDVTRATTAVTKLAEKHTLEWFHNTVIHVVPFYYPGAYRMVYPGFIQLQGFMSMNLDRHISEFFNLFRNLVRGDEDSVEAHHKFYDEYLSVMDVPAEFYLQTIERVFQRFDLPRGTFRWHGRRVKPEAIRRTAILTIEGELDDISAPGQTTAVHEMCRNVNPNMKKAHLEIGVGHYGIFNGRKWRTNIQPIIRDFMREHRASTASATAPCPPLRATG